MKRLLNYSSSTLTVTEEQKHEAQEEGEAVVFTLIRNEQRTTNGSRGRVLGGSTPDQDLVQTLEQRNAYIRSARRDYFEARNQRVAENISNSSDSNSLDNQNIELGGGETGINDLPLFRAYNYFFREDSYNRATILNIRNEDVPSLRRRLVEDGSIPSVEGNPADS